MCNFDNDDYMMLSFNACIKRYKSLLLLMFLLLWGMDTVAQGINRLVVEDVNISRAGDAELTVCMENRLDVVAAEFVLQLPNGFSLNPITVEASSRLNGHSVIVKDLGGKKYKFVVASLNNSEISGISGAIATIGLYSDETVSDNEEYSITVHDAVLCDKEGNNVLEECLSGKITVKSMPNLRVVSLHCSDPVASKPLEISWTVRNDGQGSTGNASWYDYIWLVPNIAGGTSMLGSKILAKIENLSALEPGESYENTVNVVLDERILGNYDLVVTSDMYDVNNVDFTANGGEAPVPYEPDSAQYGFLYGMTNSSLVQVEECGEYGGKSDNFFYKRVTIKVQPLPDLYAVSVVAVVDNSDSFDGESELPSPLKSAGLASSKMFYSGKKVKVTATVQNKGEVGFDPTRIKSILYMSSTEDMSGKTYNMEVNTTTMSLNADEKTTVDFTTHIPYDWYGDTYFIVQIDVDGAVYEMANTINNICSSSKIQTLLTPGADLTPIKITVPAKVVSGVPFDVEYSVDNISPGDPFVSHWNDCIYISRNSKFDGDAILVAKVPRKGYYYLSGTNIHVGGLAAPQRAKTDDGPVYVYSGDEYDVKQSVPTNKIQAGDYYVYVVVDKDNDVFEYDGEENNILRSGVIKVSNPDLKVELLSLQKSIVAGERLPVTWKIKNIGNIDISNVNIVDDFTAVLSNGDTVSLGRVANTVSIPAGHEKTLKANLNIPKTSDFSGTGHVSVKINSNSAIAESNYTNNISESCPIEFVYIPDVVNGADVQLMGVESATTVTPGALLEIKSKIYNSGNETLNGTFRITYRLTASSVIETDAGFAQISPEGIIRDFAPGDTLSSNINFHVPGNYIGGLYDLNVSLSTTGFVEKSIQNNRVIKKVYLNGNFPDIKVSDLEIPAVVTTSETFDLSWSIANCGFGSRKKVMSKVFLVSGYSKELLFSDIVDHIDEGDSIRRSAKISLEDDVQGEHSLLVEVKSLSDEYETSLTDNSVSCKVDVIQALLPDLCIDSIRYEGEWKPGNTIKLFANVRNVGECDTRKDRWSDAFYLSDSYNLDNSTAIKLYSRTRQGILEKDGSYTIEAEVQLPVNLSGHYVLFAVTDATDVMVERNVYNNSAYTLIYVDDPKKCANDLVVTRLDAPSHIVAGQKCRIEYVIENRGEYPACGILRDIIYFSKDKELGPDDVIAGVVNAEVDIASGGILTRRVYGEITNMPEGEYYMILVTNSAHTLQETDYANNSFVQSTVTNLSFPRIMLGTAVGVTTSGMYKLDVNADVVGKTICLKLDVPEELFAGLYVSYEKVPTTAKSDYSSCSYDSNEQMVFIPKVQEGTYYILAQDNSYFKKNVREFTFDDNGAIDDAPRMELSGETVGFGSKRIFPVIGGTDGWVTLNIEGALFDSIMGVRLINDDRYLFTEGLKLNNSTNVVANFNLNDAEFGTYDLLMELTDGTQSVMEDCFEVVAGRNVELAVELDAPTGVRPGANTPVSITYANGGNTDIVIKELLLVSNGAVFATTVKGLDEEKKELSIRPEGSDDVIVIPPGEQNVINCYMRLVTAITSVKIYIVR